MTSLCLYDAFECLKCVEGAEDAKAYRAAQIITASIKTAVHISPPFQLAYANRSAKSKRRFGVTVLLAN